MTRTLQRTDLFSALIVIVVGGGAFAQSLSMPRFAERGADPFTVPGLTPALVSGVIAALGLILLVRAVRGIKGDPGTITHWSRTSLMRTGMTVLLTLTYGLLLFGSAPFIPATAAFIFVFTVLADLMSPHRTLSLVPLLGGALVLGVAVAVTIHFVFTEIFLVQFPT